MTVLSSFDQDVLARTLYGEARGEPDEGVTAVISVIRNRCLHPDWPDTVGMVCLQCQQFSCWSGHPSDGNWVAVMTVDDDDLERFHDLIDKSIMAEDWDNTYGANHYLNPVACDPLPNWYDKSRVTVVIGHHEFLKL